MVNAVGNFIEHQVVSRACELVKAPFNVVENSGSILLGTIAGVGSVVTLGFSDKLNTLAADRLNRWFDPFSELYENFLRAVNPEAIIDSDMSSFSFSDVVRVDLPKILSNSSNIFSHHVLSRLCYALQGVALVIARVADFAIGLVTAALSFVTLGMIDELNGYAYDRLALGKGVADLLEYSVKTVNPWCDTSLNQSLPIKGAS